MGSDSDHLPFGYMVSGYLSFDIGSISRSGQYCKTLAEVIFRTDRNYDDSKTYRIQFDEGMCRRCYRMQLWHHLRSVDGN